MQVRSCAQCLREKPVTAFIPRTDRPWLYLSYCRKCTNLRRRDYEARNPDKHKEYTQLRNAKRAGKCCWCWEKGREVPHMYLINNKTGLYHQKCLQEYASTVKPQDFHKYQLVGVH